jgi:hypothetical protein
LLTHPTTRSTWDARVVCYLLFVGEFLYKQPTTNNKVKPSTLSGLESGQTLMCTLTNELLDC